jgi:hypothetical protein
MPGTKRNSPISPAAARGHARVDAGQPRCAQPESDRRQSRWSPYDSSELKANEVAHPHCPAMLQWKAPSFTWNAETLISCLVGHAPEFHTTPVYHSGPAGWSWP